MELCLHTKLLFQANSKGQIEEFLSKTPNPPSPMIIKSSIKTLQALEALDKDENLTLLGRHLLEIPIEPMYGKMILAGVALKCLDPVLTIVCSLSYK